MEVSEWELPSYIPSHIDGATEVFRTTDPEPCLQRKEMERRAIKRKASVKSSVQNKRSCPRNGGVTEREKPTCSGPPTLLMLIIGAQGSYMKEASGLYQFFNTCVPDTLLASFHILSIKYLHIRALLRSNDFFRVLIDTLNEEKYTYARALWIRWLEDFNKLDRFSNTKDHFPIIDKLVCAEVDYHQETPNGHPIYEKTLNKFRPFGDLRALGDISDPSLILVHRDVYNPRYDPCMHHRLPLAVIDDNKRKFELEILLLGKQKHMFMCFKLSDGIWIFYDNTRGIPFHEHHFEMLYTMKDVCICLAIYVNTTQAEEYKHGIPETRLWIGTKPFTLSRHGKILSNQLDQDPMQDLEKNLQNLSITSS